MDETFIAVPSLRGKDPQYAGLILILEKQQKSRNPSGADAVLLRPYYLLVTLTSRVLFARTATTLAKLCVFGVTLVSFLLSWNNLPLATFTKDKSHVKNYELIGLEKNSDVLVGQFALV